jgi:ABC-type transport system involved in multi-copper enzyme maturation permease subunit
LVLFLFANVFNSFSKDAAANAQLFEQLPKGIFQAININPAAYLTQIEQFISGQFTFVYLLAGSIFAFNLGVGTIGKRIENRTIAPLVTSRMSRGGVYITQFATNTLFFAFSGTLLCCIALAIMNNVLTYQQNISTSYFIGLFVGSSLLFITFSALGQLIGMLLNGEKASQIGAGIVVVSWFIASLGEFAHIPVVIQKLSLFGYFDVTLLRDSHILSGSLTVILIVIALSFTLIGYLAFRKKNLYL